MVGVVVGEEDRVDVVVADALLLHRDDGGRPAVDQQVGSLAGQLEAGVEPPAAAESVARADETELHLE